MDYAKMQHETHLRYEVYNGLVFGLVTMIGGAIFGFLVGLAI